MKNILADKIPFKASLIFTAFTLLTYIVILLINSGQFVYVLDDPYIHMTIAKHLAIDGKWAMNQMDFSSAASSPLWSLLIAGVYMVTGAAIFVPLILNILFSIAAIYAVYGLLQKFGATKYSFAILLIFIFAAPLPVLVFTGMEHVLQILLVILFAAHFARITTAEKNTAPDIIYTFLLGMLLTAVRYEDVFLLSIAGLILLFSRKFSAAIVLMIAAAIPVLIYGYVSASNGWLMVPNPLLVKFGAPGMDIVSLLKILPRAAKRMLEPDLVFFLPALLAAIIFMFKKKDYLKNPASVMLLLFSGSYLLHMMFAQTGWFYRYEAYLVSLAIPVLVIDLHKRITASGGYDKLVPQAVYRYRKFIYAVMILSLGVRMAPDVLIPLASNNIYEQHFQMAKFISENLPGKTIAANDIGIISYYTNSRIVDLWGLADIDAGRKKIAGTYNTAAIDELTKKYNAELVIVYEHWFDQYGGLPVGWKKIGSWEMTRPNLVCGTTAVDFYAPQPNDAIMLAERLQKFLASLPSSVKYIQY